MESYVNNVMEFVVEKGNEIIEKHNQCIEDLKEIGWCLIDESVKSAVFCLNTKPTENFVKFSFEDDLWIMKPHTNGLTKLELELFGDYIDIRGDVDHLTC